MEDEHYFTTGLANPLDPRNCIRSKGLAVSLNPTVLKIWMAPKYDRPGSLVRVTVCLTDDDTLALASHIIRGSGTKRLGGMAFCRIGTYMDINASIPMDLNDGDGFDLSVHFTDSAAELYAYIPFACDYDEPHAGEAERIAELLASSKRVWNPDESLRRQLNANLMEKFT